MEEQKPSVFKSSLNYGFIALGVSIIYTLLLYAISQLANQWLGYFNYVFLIVIMVICVKDYRDKKSGGFIKLGTAFQSAFFVGLISAILGAIFTFLFFTYFDPEFITQIMSKAEEQMRTSNPNMTDEQIEMGLKMAQKFTQPWLMAIMGAFMGTLFSAILAIIVAAFMKKEDKSSEMI